jgi:hypothetical protein
MVSEVNIRLNPAFFPRIGAILIKCDAMGTGIPSDVEKETPCFSVVIFLTLGEDTPVTDRLQ